MTTLAAKAAKAFTKSSRPAATHEKSRSAWNQLRANLRHADESSRHTAIDEDDEDGDDPDLTTVSIWDDFKDDGRASDRARTLTLRANERDTQSGNAMFVSAIRKARGHDGGMERPPRA